jgi:membrane-associated protease RseP (regulator of RpoE activity)
MIRTTPQRQAAQAPDAVMALVREHFDIDASWTHRGMIVARGRPLHLDAGQLELLGAALAGAGWAVRWEKAGYDWLLLIDRHRSRKMPWLAIGLFLATVVAVVFLRPLALTGFSLDGFRGVFLEELPFAFALFPILLAHEFGHYFAAKAHDYPASLPYFIPGFYPFGTFGAVIVARYPFRDRSVLFDVAVAGPLAGFLVAIPVLWYGMAHSTWVHIPEGAGLYLGDPLLMKILARLVLPGPPEPGMEILLHPAAFGGWAGLFVTMLNLLPFGPLDGGKTAYAIFGPKQKWIAWGFWGLLAVSLPYTRYFWLLWLSLALVFRLPHPPTLNDDVPLSRNRKWVGVAVLLVFVLSFMILPIKT